MKLSKKGLKKFERHEQIKKLGYVSLIDEIEFEPGDFKGMVCLTVEEAKLIKEALAIASCPSFANSDTYFALLEEIKKRIEQANEE
jgi:hypothetical protein